MASRRSAPSSLPGGDIDVDDELQLLLKEQEDFMRQRSRPAATIKRVGAAATPKPTPEPPLETEPAVDDGPQVVGLVKERDTVRLTGTNASVMPPRVTSGGFPAVKRRGESVFGRRQRQQQQPMDASTGKLSGMGQIVERPPVVAAASKPDVSAVSKPTSRSDVVTDAQWQEIDATNTETLRNMSTADIRAAQQELYSMLDPELLAKLKNRHGPKGRKTKPTNTTSNAPAATKRSDVVAATKRLAAAGIDLSKIETEEQLFAEAARLPVEERAKHEWMQPLTEPVKSNQTTKKTGSKPSKLPKQSETKASTERFDFNGDVISVASVALPSHSGLYHHGDDPDAAGYTMDELLHLARSTVASQRAVALLTISKILRKRVSETVVVAPAVLPSELLVALRMTLDDQNYTALSAAITALHAFLCDTNEEETADFESARGTIVRAPQIHRHINVGTTDDDLLREVIYIDTAESEEDGSTIGDQELASLDPVQALLKMTTVSRLSYIVTTIQLPDDDALDKVVDILMHLAAHSPRAAQAVAADRKLLKAIQTKYLENERVLTLQTEPVDAYVQAAARTAKALKLVRMLCQGSRTVATMFVENGIIQTTKGFLGVRADDVEDPALEPIQLESLRIWRVLLGYGLDFHCFAYLYPLLCGFEGTTLVRDASATATGVKRWSDRCLAAIFMALEAFARLDTIHEAQHYFNQFGFFLQLAKNEVTSRVATLAERNLVVTAALRFLTACCKLVNKFHFDRTLLIETLGALQKVLATASWREQALKAHNVTRVAVEIAFFATNILQNDLVGDDQDDDVVRAQFFLHWKPLVSPLLQNPNPNDPLGVCELLLAATGLVLRTEHHDDAFVRIVYSAALQVVQDLKPGHQYWIHRLITDVLFQPMVLQKTGIFADVHDATTMARVLIPIYQALVNSTKEQEEHSERLFAATNPKLKLTCHVVDPQDEHAYVGSNLPLPFFWMFCPFSRLEYASQASDKSNKHVATTLGPSHAEADEMKVIVSAACRYLDQLESIIGAVRSSSSSTAELGAEDKLFHLLHVFFAGTDVLFDEFVDLALSKLLQKYVESLLSNASPTALYDGLLRNLRQFESLEAGAMKPAPSKSDDATPTSFTTETQTVLTFIERLVNEFTSSSFGNTHFARVITLFVLHDFPLEIRTWVWKELAASHLLHRLEPFSCGSEMRHAMGVRATRDARRSDELLIRAMTHALASRVISHERGAFAYWLAIHHTTAYVFGDEASGGPLSGARQKFLQDLVGKASPVVWRHVLSHDTTTFAPSASAEVKQTRVERVLAHARFSEAQVAKFRQLLE